MPTQMHRGPPGPTSPCLGVGNSVISPFVVILPIFSRLYSVNQRAPSGPATMLWGPQRWEGMGNSVISPLGVVTSPKDPSYNCIAFAAGDADRKWDPDMLPDPGYYWPPNALRDDE